MKGPELALDERLRAIFPSVGSGPGEELDDAVSLLGISNLQSHIDEQITKVYNILPEYYLPPLLHCSAVLLPHPFVTANLSFGVDARPLHTFASTLQRPCKGSTQRKYVCSRL